MFDYIIGTVRFIDSGIVVLENNRIGYQLLCPNSTMIHLKLEDEICLFTYFHVKEDGLSLYGFLSREELRYFKLLISVSKIGPKIGLSILSMMTPSQVSIAISTENVSAFSNVSGVGKKTAERIILELRDKVDENNQEFPISDDLFNRKPAVLEEAADAILSLGYTQQEIQKALEGSSEQLSGMSLDEVIKFLLKYISRF